MKGNLSDLRRAVADRLAELLPKLKSCETHPGRFDEAELKRFLTAAPAVRVAILGIGAGRDTGSGEWDWPVTLAAFVATQSAGKLDRAESAQNIVWAILNAVPATDWGVDNARTPEQIRADNLTSAEVTSLGAALWAVSWQQDLRGGTNLFAAEGTMPTDLYVGVAPAIGAAHEPEYEHVDLAALGDENA
jgi:hypothetical protein